jgi:hypothetical protein
MSSVDLRPPLRGVIYQDKAIVGGVVLDDPGEPFIQEFNREYARLGLRVEAQEAETAATGDGRELRVAYPPTLNEDSAARRPVERPRRPDAVHEVA